MAQNGPNDQFGQKDLIPNWILALTRPKWTKMVRFGPFGSIFAPFRSANRTLAMLDLITISLALCGVKLLRFEIAAILIRDLGI